MADGMHISAANPSNTLIKSIISLKTYSTSRYWLIQKQHIKKITLSVILRRITSDYDPCNALLHNPKAQFRSRTLDWLSQLIPPGSAGKNGYWPTLIQTPYVN